MKKAIFLDKDGTLIYNIPYNCNPNLVCLTSGSIEGLKKLAKKGYEFFIISNQQGIALQYFTEKQLGIIRDKLTILLASHGIRLSGFYFCPHRENDGCWCRKPKPGLIKQASKIHGINIYLSWMIGDTFSDVVAGKKAGCRTILFDKGYENTREFSKSFQPEYVVRSLNEAADYILADCK